MALEIRYDASGCEGVITRVEESATPAMERNAAILAALAVAGGLAAATFDAGLLAAALFMVGIGAYGITKVGGVLPGMGSVRETFAVKNGTLSLHTEDGVEEAVLAGARITEFDDGVWVNPMLGAPVRLAWDSAYPSQVTELADALRSIADTELGARGTSREIPAEMRQIRE